MRKIAVVGLGYVGLSNAVLLAQKNQVIAVDIAAQKVDMINRHESPIVDVEIQNSKPTRYYNVQVRVREDFDTEMHIDTDDANAAAIKQGDHVEIITKY